MTKFLTSLAERMKWNPKFVSNSFNRLSDSLGFNAGRHIQSLEKERGVPVIAQALRTGDSIYYFKPQEGQEGLAFSTVPLTTPTPSVIPLPHNDAVVFDYDTHILSTAGLNNYGELCKSGGCVPQAAWLIHGGRFTFDEVIDELNRASRDYDHDEHTFYRRKTAGGRAGGDFRKVAAIPIEETREKVPMEGGGYMTRSLPNPPAEVAFLDFTDKLSTDAQKEILTTMMQNHSNFGLAVGLKRGRRRWGHAFGFYDGRPVAEVPWGVPYPLVAQSILDHPKIDPKQMARLVKFKEMVSTDSSEAMRDTLSQLSKYDPTEEDIIRRENEYYEKHPEELDD